ncbi:MAG: hypothetical protein ACOH13_12640 [Flavobacteriales bacterium]
MRPIELSQTEVDLITTLLGKRKSTYIDTSAEFVKANASYFKKMTQQLDKVLHSLVAGENHLGSNAKELVQGCMNEHLMEQIKRELGLISRLTQPARYRHHRDHPDQVERLNLILGLWNKLVKKEERYRLPTEFMTMMDEVFTAERVYASFSKLKPYKIAFFVRAGRVYRLSLESEREQIEGPHEYTEEDLSQIFMKVQTPEAFLKALKEYGKETRLNAWHALFLEKFAPLAV